MKIYPKMLLITENYQAPFKDLTTKGREQINHKTLKI